MNFLRISTVFVGLGSFSLGCSHYDPKRPDISKKSTQSPTFEGGTKNGSVDAEIGASQDAGNTITEGTSSASSPKLPGGLEAPVRLPDSPDPMAGPGLSTGPVPVPVQPPANPPAIPVTPPSAPVKVETYKEAQAEFLKAKAKDVNLKNYWVGGGYDVLTGNRFDSCLEPSNLQTRVTSRMETTDSYSVAHDYNDLYKKLETEFGADVGGMWQIFTGSLSFKTKILKETKMTTDDVVVVAGFTYLRDTIALQNPGITYAQFFQSLSEKNRELYRKYCGDKFTKDVTIGASMHLVFTAKKTDSLKHNQTDVDAAIRVGLSGIFGVGGGTTTSKEQKEILNSYSFSTKCYTLGTTSDVCGGYSTTTAFNINTDIATIQKRIQDVKAKMFAEVKEGKNLAVVRETLLDYEVPLEACTRDGSSPCPSRWEYFSDYRDRLAKLKKLSLNKSEADEVCAKAPYWSKRCNQVNESYSVAMSNCLSLTESCEQPNEKDFKIILTAKNPGRLELFDSDMFRGGVWPLDFRNFLDDGSLQANRVYDFENANIGNASRRVTSVRSLLDPTWTVKFYTKSGKERPSQSQPVLKYTIQGARDVGNVGKDANDSFTSFELIPTPDL